MAEVLRVVLTDPKIQAYRDHMTEHAVICKFMGLWPMERALCQWIKQQWKPKGDVSLHLGAKGFFTVVFSNLEDKDRVFDGGPYFFASAGLYMKPWKSNFVPEKETFTQVPVWIHLFVLPIDYWGYAALKQIGDKLGTFIKASEATLQRRYTSCTRICVEMNVSGALHEGLWLEYRDEDYFQAIDYEQIPFRCRKCHENGHLIREYPLNRTTETHKEEQEEKFRDTFTRPRTKQRANRKRPSKTSVTRTNTSNAFEVLETETDLEDHNKENKNSVSNKATTEATTKGMEENNPNNTKKDQEGTEGADEDSEMFTSDIGNEEMELHEVLGLEGVNLPDMVEDWRKNGMENISKEEVRKINEILIAKQKAKLEMQNRKLGVAKGMGLRTKSVLQTTSGSNQRKKRGRKSNNEALQEMGHFLLNFGKMKALEAFSIRS